MLQDYQSECEIREKLFCLLIFLLETQIKSFLNHQTDLVIPNEID